MPGQIELYLHRVGRTARASARGRSISLVGEPDRKMLKAVMKRSDAGKVKHRLIPPDQVKAMMQKLEELKPEVTGVLQEEQAEKEVRRKELGRKTMRGQLIFHPCVDSGRRNASSKGSKYDRAQGPNLV